MATSSTGSTGGGPDVTSKLPVTGGRADGPRTGQNSTGQEPARTARTGAAAFTPTTDTVKSTSRSVPRGGGDDAPAKRRQTRRIRLTLARLDPFSVMKLSFLIAVAVGIATVVSVAVLWNIVDAIGLWAKLDQLGRDLNGGKPLPFMDFFQFKKMVSYGVVVAFVNLVIITALGTLLAFLYNIVAALLGGLRMTFTDE